MRHLTAFLIGIGILVAGALAAPDAGGTSDRQKRIDAARRDLAAAESRARAARREVQETQRDLENAISYAQTSAQTLRKLNDQEGDYTRELLGKEREAREQKDARDRVASVQSDADKKLLETRKAIVEGTKALEAGRKRAEAKFLDTPESKERLAKIESARQALQAEYDRVIADLSKQADYQALKANAVATEQAVGALRNQSRPDPGELARASQAWIDAKSRLESSEKAACQADPAYVEAEQALTALRRDHEAALAQFRQTLNTDPVVGPLMSDLETRNREQTQLLADQKRLVADLKQADDTLKGTTRQYNEGAARLKALRAERDKLVLQAQGAERTVESKRRELVRDEADARDADRDVDTARRRLRDAER